MASKLSVHMYPASDLECGHDSIWGGIVETSQGQHALPLDCAICTSRESAMNDLRAFALYDAMTPEMASDRPRVSRPRVMKAGSGPALI